MLQRKYNQHMFTGYILHVHARRALLKKTVFSRPLCMWTSCRAVSFANEKSHRKSHVSKVDEADDCRLETGPTLLASYRHDLSSRH
jgi:hypothetical protein